MVRFDRMRRGHHQSDEEMMGTGHATPSHFHPVSQVTPSQQRYWETGRPSTLSSYSLPTAHLQQNTAAYLSTQGNSTRTPNHVGQVPCSSSFFTPFTPSVPTLHIPPISQGTSGFSVEADSSSTLSRDSPFSSTLLTQPSTWRHRNSNQDSSYRSTFHLRASQETESHPSNSSFHLSGYSSISPNIDVNNLVRRVEAIDVMGDTNTHGLPNALQQGESP